MREETALDVWAGVNDGTIRGALERLARLPMSETFNGVQVPFRFIDKEHYKQRNSNTRINRAIEAAPVCLVRLAGLRSSQNSVVAERVAQYVRRPNLMPRGQRSPDHGGLVDYPIVIDHRGERVIHDGNHRLCALWLRRMQHAFMRLVLL